MSLRECQQKVDAAEFNERWADYLLEPWGDLRRDYQAALIAQTIAASQGVNTVLSDHMIKWAEEEQEQPDDTDILAAKLMRAFGIEGE